MLTTEIGRLQVQHVEGGNHEFGFRNVELEMSVRHPTIDFEQAVGYMSFEFR